MPNRCVPESQRSFSLGLQWLFLRLLGNVPGPIIMGLIIDRSCVLWSVKCNIRNNCWIYNNQQMRQLILIIGITFKIVTTICYFLAWKFYKAEVQKDLEPEIQKDSKPDKKETTV